MRASGSAWPLVRVSPADTIHGVDDTTTAPDPGTSVASTPTTLLGPNGTAPGISFVEQQQQPVLDSTAGRAAGAPLAIAALLFLVVFTTVLLRAARAKRRRTPGGV